MPRPAAIFLTHDHDDHIGANEPIAKAGSTRTGGVVVGQIGSSAIDTAAIAAHQPFVLVFATPKFCASAQCGPTLDRIKPLAAAYPSVSFIHVEPYQLTFQNGSLQPVLDAQGDLQPTQSVFDWGLLSEPWVFAVNRDGVVTASFEGIVSADEIRSAAAAIK